MNKIRKTILLIILAIGFVVTAIILYNHQGSSDTQNYIAKIVPLEIKYIVDLSSVEDKGYKLSYMDYKSPELTARVIIDNARDYIMLFMEKNNYDEGDFHPKVSLFNEYSPVLIITKVSIRPRPYFSPSYNKVKSQTKHVWLLTLFIFLVYPFQLNGSKSA